LNAPSSLGQSIVTRRQGGLRAADDSRRPIVVVLGMHRSGTSLCSHILSMLGVDMADDVGSGDSNQKGHWERWEIVGLHDEILALFDRGFFTPQHDFPLPTAWWAEPKVRAVQSRIESFLTARMPATGLFGFKDPRTARLLPLWLQIFKNLNLAPRFVLCLRAPSQIARSLRQRDGLDLATGEYRALVYVADCFRYIPGRELCIVDYEKWFDNYADNLNGLRDFLDIEWDQSETDLAAAVTGIVERDLRHSEERLGVARQPLIRSFHNLVAGLRNEPARRAEIDHFVNQFVAFQQLLGPFERVQRDYAVVAARVPGFEARIAVLEAALHTTESAGREREQALREILMGVAGERDAAHTALADAALALAANDRKVAARMAEVESKVAELENIRTALQTAEERQRELSEIAAKLPERDAKLAALASTLEANNAAGQLREQTLNEHLSDYARQLETDRAAFLELKRDEHALRVSNVATIGELDAAREELATAEERELGVRLSHAARVEELQQTRAMLTNARDSERNARAELHACNEQLERAPATKNAIVKRPSPRWVRDWPLRIKR
jgi:hypothetical protein